MTKGQDQTESVLHHHGPEERQLVHLIDGQVVTEYSSKFSMTMTPMPIMRPRKAHILGTVTLDPVAESRFRDQLFLSAWVAYLFVSRAVFSNISSSTISCRKSTRALSEITEKCPLLSNQWSFFNSVNDMILLISLRIFPEIMKCII